MEIYLLDSLSAPEWVLADFFSMIGGCHAQPSQLFSTLDWETPYRSWSSLEWCGLDYEVVDWVQHFKDIRDCFAYGIEW